MSKEISLVKYTNEMETKWDNFVLNESINGTILQTRRFLNYHPKTRFIDSSFVFFSGNNIIAVIPANYLSESNEIVSHQGSTFGGIVLSRNSCKINALDAIFSLLENYIKSNKIERITLRQTGVIYQKYHSVLVDYYYFLHGFQSFSELGYYIDLKNSSNNIIEDFRSSTRRKYRYSLKNDLTFRELIEDIDIEEFYNVLCDNYRKFDKKPVHSLNEIKDLYHDKLAEFVRFYGVFKDDEMLAGAMIFVFDKQVFHTQYLAVRQDSTKQFINEYLYTNLIIEAKKESFDNISFGTVVLDYGKIMNHSLAMYKEGYGTNTYIDYVYTKKFNLN